MIPDNKVLRFPQGKSPIPQCEVDFCIYSHHIGLFCCLAQARFVWHGENQSVRIVEVAGDPLTALSIIGWELMVMVESNV